MLNLFYTGAYCQDDQASLLLDLKKTRAAYQIARQKSENDKALYENKAISEDEFNKSKNELMGAEVEYQKQILRVMAQQSYIIVEKAVKYRNSGGQRRTKVVLRSTLEGNREYLEQFREHFDVFTPEMRSGQMYNIFVSLETIDDGIIIGSPYEIRIPRLELGESVVADFGLLRDVESLQVHLNYSGKSDLKKIQLVQDVASDMVDISTSQFSQEVDLGSSASYDLSLERFSGRDDTYKLMLINLPQQINYDFIDVESSARLSQVKFSRIANVKRLSLKLYLPDRVDDEVVIDKPVSFYVLVLSPEQFGKYEDIVGKTISDDEINNIPAGKLRLELIPRGVAKIEVQSPSLYYEITSGDSVSMNIIVRNAGTRRLDNIHISTDNPLEWSSRISPDLISSLAQGKEVRVSLVLLPPPDAGIGAREIKILTEAMADNQNVESEEKTIRIQVNARAQFLWTAVLILFLVGMVIGIVVFGIKVSRR